MTQLHRSALSGARRPSAGRAVRRLLVSALLLAGGGCLPIPHPEEPLVVYGEVFDNRTIRPIPNAEIAIRFPRSLTARTVETDERGRFSVPSHGGWKYFVSMIPGGEQPDDLRVRASIEHPDYQGEYIDEPFPLEGDPPKVNLGAVYLEPK